MAVWSQINLSRIKRDRFDAEFFRPDYLKNIEKLKATGPCQSLFVLFRSIRRGRQPQYSPKGTVPVLRSVNVGFMSFNETRQEYVDSSFFDLNESGKVLKDDVLITSTGIGTIGRTSIWHNDNNCFCDGHLTILRNAAVSPYLVAVFLNCKLGLNQLERHYRGSSGQIEIYPYDIGKIEIPNILISHQDEIEGLVTSYFTSLCHANSSRLLAQQLLDAELGLDKLTFQKPVGYIAQLSDIELSRRFDPEHYFPAFRAFCAGLPSHVTLSPLSNHLEFCQRGKQPIYAKTGLPVINSKHVQPNRVIQEGNRSALANPVADLQIRFGDTLINGTGRGTIGRAAPYLSDTLAVADNHVTILRSSNLDPAFLALYLNSAAGQMQVEMHQRGTSGQLELYPFDIRKFLVWPAPVELQRELRDLYDKATAAERESRQLLEQAKARVEQLIEEAVQP